MKILKQEGILKIFEISNRKGIKRVIHSFNYDEENYTEISENDLEKDNDYVPFADREFIDGFANKNINSKFRAELVILDNNDDVKELGYFIREKI